MAFEGAKIMLDAQVDSRKLQIALKHFPKELKIYMDDAMDHISRKFMKEFRLRRLQGPPGIRSGPPGRAGIFSWFRRMPIKSPTIEGSGFEIYTNSPIAKLHETGGVRTNPDGGKLAVPLSARTEMFTPKGLLKKRYKKPGALKNVEKVKIKGKEYLAKIKKRQKTILPLYVLKNKVYIQPRLGFYSTWNKMEPVRMTILNKAIDKAIRSF